MLLTDDYITTTAELAAYDPEVEDVATSVGITLDGDHGLIQQATTACLARLMTALEAMSVGYGDRISSNHLAAVFNLGPVANSPRPRVHPSQVVLHETLSWGLHNTIKQWAIAAALAMFFEQCAQRRVTEDDRYAKKAARHNKRAESLWIAIERGGVPVVLSPLPCPGAKLWSGSGSWSSSNVTQVSSVGASGGTFRVAICWTAASYDASAYDRGNAESSPSRTVSVTVTANNKLSVSIAGLTPPAGGPAPGGVSMYPACSSLIATGWQVLVGAATGPLYIQNAAPIALDTTSYALDEDPVLSGLEARPGQTPWSRVQMFPTFNRW
jgi:hypothetical protein